MNIGQRVQQFLKENTWNINKLKGSDVFYYIEDFNSVQVEIDNFQGDVVKTKQEIECMKQKLSQKIETLGEKARNTPYGSAEWLMCDRECAKCVAQYNTLLDVLN